MQNTAYRTNAGEGMVLHRQQLEDYIDYLGKKGITERSCSAYQNRLYNFYEHLPEDHRVNTGTLQQMQKDMQESGVSAGTVNGFTTVVNGLLDFCGHRELQAGRLPAEKRKEVPKLSRDEYLRLLSAAKAKGRERIYLVTKTFASTGIMIEELPDLTVETVKNGCMETSHGQVRIPGFLCKELLDYASRHGIGTGTVFQTRGGKPIDRCNLNHEIKLLSEDANVPAEKCAPRCLRQLYQRTQKKIRDDIEVLVEREFSQILKSEQDIIGWNA